LGAAVFEFPARHPAPHAVRCRPPANSANDGGMSKQITKPEKLSLRVDRDLRVGIEQAAAAERRPVSHLICIVLQDWLAARQNAEGARNAA
jgi:hypothetical protein